MTSSTLSSGSPSLIEVNTIEALQTHVSLWRHAGQRIGFVPTMGYLHEGHLSLIRAAKQRTQRVVVSIFVNPTQFGPTEDLAKYPRDLEGDRQKIVAAGGDLVFIPEVETMYPPSAQTFVQVSSLTQSLCGEFRPEHFRGVTTIVAKLFHIVWPDIAVFGEKDYQQLAVIRQMTKDLFFPIEILGGRTVREDDGLALSSRNVYLTPSQRQSATCLSQAIRTVRQQFAEGERDPSRLLSLARNLIEQTPETRVQYIELRDAEQLESVEDAVNPSDRLFLAVHVGQTRLIDNAPVGGDYDL